MALSDHADHEGNNAYPGVDLLAWKTNYSERQVRRILEWLEKKEIIVREGGGLGRGNMVSYQILLQNAPKKPPRQPRKKSKKARQAERKKVDKMSTFSAPGQGKPGPKKADILTTFPAEKKVDIPPKEKRTFSAENSEKVDISDSPHDKDRARINRPNEPSIEPSVEEAPSTPFDNFDDPLSALALAIARVMGYASVPDGVGGDQINALAELFLAAGVTPQDVIDFDDEWHRRKAGKGQRYVMTIPILQSDVPTWVRSRRKQNEAARPRQAAPAAPLPDVPPRARTGKWGQALDLLDAMIGPLNVASWIEPLDFRGVENSQVRLHAVDTVFRDWIGQNYSTQLSDALREAGLGDKFEIIVGGLNGNSIATGSDGAGR
jgi:hypothetical protein